MTFLPEARALIRNLHRSQYHYENQHNTAGRTDTPSVSAAVAKFTGVAPYTGVE